MVAGAGVVASGRDRAERTAGEDRRQRGRWPGHGSGGGRISWLRAGFEWRRRMLGRQWLRPAGRRAEWKRRRFKPSSRALPGGFGGRPAQLRTEGGWRGGLLGTQRRRAVGWRCVRCRRHGQQARSVYGGVDRQFPQLRIEAGRRRGLLGTQPPRPAGRHARRRGQRRQGRPLPGGVGGQSAQLRAEGGRRGGLLGTQPGRPARRYAGQCEQRQSRGPLSVGFGGSPAQLRRAAGWQRGLLGAQRSWPAGRHAERRCQRHPGRPVPAGVCGAPSQLRAEGERRRRLLGRQQQRAVGRLSRRRRPCDQQAWSLCGSLGGPVQQLCGAHGRTDRMLGFGRGGRERASALRAIQRCGRAARCRKHRLRPDLGGQCAYLPGAARWRSGLLGQRRQRPGDAAGGALRTCRQWRDPQLRDHRRRYRPLLGGGPGGRVRQPCAW